MEEQNITCLSSIAENKAFQSIKTKALILYILGKRGG
jgi:hypothetical protein